MYYHFLLHNDSDGLWAECIELKGCLSQSENNTMDDLILNMEVNLFLDEPVNSNIIFPEPDNTIIISENIVKIKVNPEIAFANQIRKLRLTHHLTQKQAAEKLGFKHIWSYQRLENSKKANPELKTIIKIKEVFPEFDFSQVI